MSASNYICHIAAAADDDDHDIDDQDKDGGRKLVYYRQQDNVQLRKSHCSTSENTLLMKEMSQQLIFVDILNNDNEMKLRGTFTCFRSSRNPW